MYQMEWISKYQEALNRACLAFQVNELFVFGSVLTERFRDDSDVDFIVSLLPEDPLEYAENYFNLKQELEDILKRKVDLLEEKAIRNKTFENIINQRKMLVYARRNQGMA